MRATLRCASTVHEQRPDASAGTLAPAPDVPWTPGWWPGSGYSGVPTRVRAPPGGRPPAGAGAPTGSRAPAGGRAWAGSKLPTRPRSPAAAHAERPVRGRRRARLPTWPVWTRQQGRRARHRLRGRRRLGGRRGRFGYRRSALGFGLRRRRRGRRCRGRPLNALSPGRDGDLLLRDDPRHRWRAPLHGRRRPALGVRPGLRHGRSRPGGGARHGRRGRGGLAAAQASPNGVEHPAPGRSSRGRLRRWRPARTGAVTA